MTRTVRIAAVQLRAHDSSDFGARFPSIVHLVETAARDADLVVLPEATIPAYVLGSTDLDDAAVARAVEILCSLAKRHETAIVVGVAMRERGILRNRAIAIDRDGRLAGSADKLFLWHFDRKWFEAGERLLPVQTSVGSLGLLVCADGRMPAVARTLVDRGAELLVMPTAWVTSGRDADSLENAQADLLGRVRAFENSVPFVAANKCGVERGMVAYCGKSQVLDARGEPLALAGQHVEEIVCADVEISAPQMQRALAQNPPFRHSENADHPLRLAIAAGEPGPGIDDDLSLLDVSHLVTPCSGPRREALDRVVAAVEVPGDAMFDPGYLVPFRLAGYVLAIWNAGAATPWTERIARARALELRIYVVVFTADRAFAVDPDGAIVAGTFGEYRLASFAFDPHKTRATSVAPGTDVIEGLKRIDAIVHGTAS